MNTYVEFRSEAFPAYEDEVDEASPGRHGRRLAEFLAGSLLELGIESEPPFAEDWGWVVPIVNPDFRTWIGCGNYDEYPDGYLCFIEPHKPFVRRWFKKVDTRPTIRQLEAAIDQSLRQHPEVSAIRWSSHDAFMAGATAPN